MSAPIKAPFEANDIVGIELRTYRDGVVIKSRIATKGKVLRWFRTSRRGNWRVEVEWDDPQKAWLYLGKTDWAYPSELTLVQKADSIKIPRGPRIEEVYGYQGRLS